MLKKIIDLIFTFITGRVRPYGGTGVHRDPQDYRDITVASFQSRLPQLPLYSDGLQEVLKQLPVLDQGQHPACVPHAISILLMAYIYRKTGKVVHISPRVGYKICKILDGIDAPGTYPRCGALGVVNFGYALEELCENDISLSYQDYLDVKLTKEILQSCSENKLPGFAYVNAEIEAVKQAIHLYGAVTATTIVGSWNTLPLRTNKMGGAHYTLWYKYETMLNGDVKIYIRNSWGPKWLDWVLGWMYPGNGYFYWSEYKDLVESIIAFTDIPADYLNKVKNMPYRFTTEMGLGKDHPQVKELQKMLNTDPETMVAIDKAGSKGFETSYFGPATKKALIKWQTKHGILPATGYFGPKSMVKANEGVGNMNRITDWANAIKKHEGYFKGSRSYKNNNPGNIRYSGIFANMAIGQDDKKFCIFKTYDEGFEALKTLLIRAASGLSSVYKPSMTLTQFYAVYAPASDNNDVDAYAKAIASALGVTTNTKIKDLL